MLVSYFKDAYQKTPVFNTELNIILGQIKNGDFKNQILSLRKLTNPDEIKKAKINLPNFTASGYFTNCNDDCLIDHSGAMQIDFDLKDILKAGLTKDELRKKLLADNYIYSLFDSPTNTGLKAIVKIPTIEHLGSFLALEKYFLEKYKVQIDRSCKNISRRFFVSYDKDLYLNKDSEIFAEIAHEEKEFKEFSKEIDKEIFREAVNHIPGKSKDDGKRSYYLNIIWACKTVLGESEAFSIGEKLLSSSDMIKDLPSIIRTGKTILHPQLVFKEAISAGWIYPKKTKSKVVNINSKRNSIEGNLAEKLEPEPEKKQFVNSKYEMAREWLKTNFSFRYNILKDNVYYSQLKNDRWDIVTDRTVNNFLQDLDKMGIVTNDNRINTILNSDYLSIEYNPIKVYFDSLDISSIDPIRSNSMELFFEAITGKNLHENLKLFDSMKTWFCSLAGISLGQLDKVNELYCLCFAGESGNGKTTLMRWLAPVQLREYVKENLTDFENKDTKISLAENFLILLDELGESSKHDLIKLKSLITQKSITERRPFAKRDCQLERRAGFLGTFDKGQVFTDNKNRRYLVLETVKIDWKKLESISIDELWKEAKYFFLNNLYSKTIDQNNIEANRQYEVVNKSIEALAACFVLDDSNSLELEFMTNTQIVNFLESKGFRVSQRELGIALKDLEIKKEPLKIKGVSTRGYFLQKK